MLWTRAYLTLSLIGGPKSFQPCAAMTPSLYTGRCAPLSLSMTARAILCMLKPLGTPSSQLQATSIFFSVCLT